MIKTNHSNNAFNNVFAYVTVLLGSRVTVYVHFRKISLDISSIFYASVLTCHNQGRI
jgi:hypothetical protein